MIKYSVLYQASKPRTDEEWKYYESEKPLEPGQTIIMDRGLWRAVYDVSDYEGEDVIIVSDASKDRGRVIGYFLELRQWEKNNDSKSYQRQ